MTDMALPRRRRHGWLNTAAGIAILAVLLFPVYWMINVSLQRSGSAVGTPWIPIHVTLHGYAKALHDQGRHLLTSMIISLGSVAFSLIIATPAAYALAHFRIRGAQLVLLGILVSQMVPGIVVANALYSAYNDLGLLNSIGGLILADSTAGVPFAIIILRSSMQSIPREIIEAARVDGAGRLGVFRSVVLPVSTNALITAA